MISSAVDSWIALDQTMESRDKRFGMETAEQDGWQAPNPGVLKINLDAFPTSPNHRGLSAVICDYKEELATVACTMEYGTWDAEISKVAAACFGLQVVVLLGLQDAILETDSKLTVQALKNRSYKATYSSSFIKDCHALSNSLSSISYSFVRRTCDKVTHKTANFAFMVGKLRSG